MFLYAILLVTCTVLCTYAALDLKGMTKTKLAKLEAKKMSECLKKSGVNITTLSGYLNEKSNNTTKEFRCVLGCFTEEMGYGKDNKPLWDIMEKVHKIEYGAKEYKEKALKIVETCKTIVPKETEDSCELGFAMHSCNTAQTKKLGLTLE
uniref:Odorant-binding protein RproOBP4 n=1 Tax=Rhodnius prolixus TaxID=13249 RepID=C5J8H0_RHOPR|nr:odorant-binding protein RproOBP4 precursor [Rhodnius prolixus]